MRMPFERVRPEEAKALATMALDAVASVSVDGEMPVLCGLDSDMQPTANVNDARYLCVMLSMGDGKVGMGMLRVDAGGVMHHLKAGRLS